VAVLERDRPRRSFRRLTRQVLADLLADGAEPAEGEVAPSDDLPPSDDVAVGSATPGLGTADTVPPETADTAEAADDTAEAAETSTDTDTTDESPSEEEPDEGPGTSGDSPGTDR
jgi:proteasome alpha subunit